MTDTCDSVIRSLEEHPSRLNKEAILEAQANFNNIELFDGIRLALDNLITFGVKKVPSHGGPDGQGLPWVAFVELASLLAKRELTGDDAKKAIELALSASTKAQWNDWYRRILIKDLRCGVSEKTVNKVLKGFPNIKSVPVFECMLAHDGANHEKKITGKKLLEPKLDGVRVITVVNYELRTVQQFSRNGKELLNFSHITDELAKHIDDFGRSYILDGEIISSSFQDLMKQVHRKDDVAATDAKLMLFDILPLSEFRNGKSVQTQKIRSNLLRSFNTVWDAVPSIELVPQTAIDLDGGAIADIQFKQYNKDAIEAGYEGIMIKDPSALYECKRSVAWLKQKPFIEVSLAVIAVEEGTGKNEGRLGALICEGEDDGKVIRVNVGSGFTDDQRTEYWMDKESMVGQIVEVRADAATLSQDSEQTWSLRFPRFLRFRGFVAGEKL
jgi:DNA ligase-1